MLSLVCVCGGGHSPRVGIKHGRQEGRKVNSRCGKVGLAPESLLKTDHSLFAWLCPERPCGTLAIAGMEMHLLASPY